MMQVGIALNTPTIDFILHPQRWDQRGRNEISVCGTTWASCRCRAHSRSAISDHQVSVERFLFQNKMAEGVSSGITTTLKKLQSRELSPAHSLRFTPKSGHSAWALIQSFNESRIVVRRS